MKGIQIGEAFMRVYGNSCSYEDNNSILWKLIDNELIGKRAVKVGWCTSKWMEDVNDNDIIKYYWKGDKNANYKEVFKK